MKTKINSNFYLRKSKVNSKDESPIYLRITINLKRFDVSTGIFITPSNWSSDFSKIKGNSLYAKSINEQLDRIKFRIKEIERELFVKNLELNIENFKNEYSGIQPKKLTLIPIFQDHNNKIKELIGQEYAHGTFERYQTSLKHTQDFLNWKYKLKDIEIDKIDLSFITEYEYYLRTERKCANNSAVKYIKNFKKIIRICIANGWIDKDPFANYKSKIKEVQRDFLSQEELIKLIQKDFKNNRLENVRDIFIFSCFTGLAYIDVKQLTQDNVTIGIDGEKWIFKNRQKTDVNSRIPLLPTAQLILDKYENHPVCLNENKLLPVLSNQKMNAYLKEIADVCGINKELTFHIARHTFATTVTLSNGVPIETVSKMLGHTNLKTTQHYAKILDTKISNDMMILKDKFNSQIVTISKSS